MRYENSQGEGFMPEVLVYIITEGGEYLLTTLSCITLRKNSSGRHFTYNNSECNTWILIKDCYIGDSASIVRRFIEDSQDKL